MVSIKDIARKVGVSPSTVSFVLNGKGKEMRISDDLSERIQKISLELGYQRNQVAVSLRTGKSNIIALIVDTITGSFFSSLAQVVEQEAQRFGYRVIYCSTGNNLRKGTDLIQLLNRYHVDGYLIIPSEGMEKDLEFLMTNKKPLVLMDSYFPGMAAPYVLVDNFKGIAEGMQHLLSKGYKKIGFVCNDLNMIQMQERKRGYVETLKANKVRFRQGLICQTAYGSAKEEVLQEITAYLAAEKPEAVLFAANYLGVYGLEAVKSLGLSIPDDIALICFDDLDLFNLYPPGITSIRQPIEDIAKTAIHILMEEMGADIEVSHRQVELPAQMINRQSA